MMNNILKRGKTRHVLSAAFLFACLLALPPVMTGQETLFDSLGRKVSIPARVERIISIDPESTRIIVALGAGDKLVGLDYFLRNHDRLFRIIFPASEKLPVVTNGGQDLNLELALALKPDIVFVSPSEVRSPDGISARLRVPVAALVSTGRFDILLSKITFLGRMLGRRERAAELTAYFSSMMEDVRRRTAALPAGKKPRVFLSFWGTLENTPVHYDPVDWAGGINLASSLLPLNIGSAGTVVQLEKVIAWDPDMILVHGNYRPSERKVSVAGILADKRLRLMRAVREGNVHYTFGFWYWWDPALVMVETIYLGRLLHPELFQDIDLRRTAEAIFEKFYGGKDLFGTLGAELKCDEWFAGI